MFASPVTKNFVQVIRAVEFVLANSSANVTQSFGATSQLLPLYSPEVRATLQDAIPILQKLGAQIPLPELFNFSPKHKREPLTTVYVFVFVRVTLWALTYTL